MPRGVYKVKRIVFSAKLICHLYGMAFYGDATFAFKIHVVKHLRLHILAGHGIGIFKQAVGKSAFAVVDMRYYAEIAYIFHSVVIFSNCKINNFRANYSNMP